MQKTLGSITKTPQMKPKKIQICRKNLRTQIDCCNDLTQPSASLGRERNQNKEPGITFIEDNRVGWCVSLDE